MRGDPHSVRVRRAHPRRGNDSITVSGPDVVRRPPHVAVRHWRDRNDGHWRNWSHGDDWNVDTDLNGDVRSGVRGWSGGYQRGKREHGDSAAHSNHVRLRIPPPLRDRCQNPGGSQATFSQRFAAQVRGCPLSKTAGRVWRTCVMGHNALLDASGGRPHRAGVAAKSNVSKPPARVHRTRRVRVDSYCASGCT